MRHVVLDSFHRLEALHEGSPVYIGRGMGLLIQDGFIYIAIHLLLIKISVFGVLGLGYFVIKSIM